MERLARCCVADEVRGVSNERTVLGTKEDEPQAIRLIGYFAGTTEETEGYLGLLWIRTRNRRRQEIAQAQVTAVATALLEHRILSAQQVRAIARKAFGAVLETKRC